MKYFKKLTLVAFAASLLAMGGVASTPAPAQALTQDEKLHEQQLYDKTNAYRVQHGLGKLTPSDQLDELAQYWADYLAKNSVFYHNPNVFTSIFSKPGWYSGAENLAAGQSDGVAAGVALYNSPGHKTNMLNKDSNRIGVGVAYGGHYGVYYVQVFGGTNGADKGNLSLYTTPKNDKPAQVNLERLQGADRYATNAAIVNKKFTKADTVFLVSGGNFPDALSASSAAAKNNAPIIMVPSSPGSVSQVTKNLVQRLNPLKVVVVGGEDRIPNSVVNTVFNGAVPTMERLAGPDRFETSAMVSKANWDSSSKVFIATGNNFPDALALSAAAGANGAPVILVNGGANTLSPTVKAEIARLGASEVYIAGGSSTVSQGIENDLKKLAKVERFAGNDRFHTSALIAKKFFPTATTQYLATGSNYPDALAASVNAGLDNAPLLLSMGNCQPSTTLELTRKATKLYILGSADTLNANVERFKAC